LGLVHFPFLVLCIFSFWCCAFREVMVIVIQAERCSSPTRSSGSNNSSTGNLKGCEKWNVMRGPPQCGVSASKMRCDVEAGFPGPPAPTSCNATPVRAL
jgi:hypothetical protein